MNTRDYILNVALLLCGATHFCILFASALTPKVMGWKKELSVLPRLLQQLFWVYGSFIVLSIVAIGVLTLLHANAMAEGDSVARSVAAFAAVFWGARLMVQFFVFDARPYLTNGWLKLGYNMLTVAFIFLVLTYSTAALQLHR